MTQSVKRMPYAVDANGCHVYALTARDRNGYARVRRGNRLRMAHVVAYEQAHGPVPAGREVMHARGCRRDCINPEHLSAGTHAENMAQIKEDRKQFCAAGHQRTSRSGYSFDGHYVCRICRIIESTLSAPSQNPSRHK